MTTVHIVGAGMAGLACAVRLAGSGRRVVLHESAGHAGGRCRSFEDDALGCLIDNGNHLLLSGNTAVNRYLADTGASNELSGPDDAVFPFVDLPEKLRWTLRIEAGRIPWWILQRARRIPGTGIHDYLCALRLGIAGRDTALGEVFAVESPMFRRFWEPLAVAVLNTPARLGSAALLWEVVSETFGRGAEACRPRIARRGLSETFVHPALAHLTRNGAEIRFNHRLRAIERVDGVVSALHFGEDSVTLAPDDTAILAVPAPVAGDLLSDLTVPRQCHAIVNAHFPAANLPRPATTPAFLGLIGATAHWLFFRGDIVSVTVSAADALAERPAGEIAGILWRDVCAAVNGAAMPMPDSYRIIKEKRATFSQTPESVRLRPPQRTRFRNLFLAGDWTQTRLPATIEGAIRSGNAAAAEVLGENA